MRHSGLDGTALCWGDDLNGDGQWDVLSRQALTLMPLVRRREVAHSSK